MARRPKTRYAKSGEIYIAYQVTGEGPVDLVYVPTFFGAMEHYWDYAPTAVFFDRLADCGRLALFDRLATGMSDVPLVSGYRRSRPGARALAASRSRRAWPATPSSSSGSASSSG